MLMTIHVTQDVQEAIIIKLKIIPVNYVTQNAKVVGVQMKMIVTIFSVVLRNPFKSFNVFLNVKVATVMMV